MSEKILLTITMLVSDREDTIEKCMKSLVHLRETVPSELIVVDTAGNEKCMEIVRQYTDKIVRFEWINDFAAARNAGVKLAKGEWLMFLDDDEWFETTEELEDFFLSGKYKKYGGAAYIVRSYMNVKGTSWNDFDALRLGRLTKGAKFVGKIHEYFSGLEPPFYYAKDYVHHYGYVFKNTQERYEHSWRNIRLLLEMHKKDPRSSHTIGQLIQEYDGVGEYFSAIELCKELLNLPGCWDSLGEARSATYAAMTEAKLYARQHRYEDGYQFVKELLEKPKISLLARGILNNFMISFCYQLKKYEETLEYIERYKDSYERWIPYPDKKLMDAFSACGKYMEESELKRFELVRIHVLVLCERWQEAGDCILNLDWQSKEQKILPETPGDVMDVLRNLPYDSRYLDVVKNLKRSFNYSRDMYKVYDGASREDQRKLMAYFSLLPPKDSKMCLYHLIYAGEQKDFGLAVPALEEMRECGFPFFLTDKLYWDSLNTLNVNINSYMDNLSVYEWMELARRVWAEAAMETCESAYLCLIRGLDRGELRFLYLSGLMMEKRLLSETAPRKNDALEGSEAAESLNEKTEISETTEGYLVVDSLMNEKPDSEEKKKGDSHQEKNVSEESDDNGATVADDASEKTESVVFTWQTLDLYELWEKVNQIAQYWVSCAASLYREDVFLSDLIQAIPPAYRFGWYIMQANAVKDEDHSLFLHKVADAAKAYPVMKELCKRVITEDAIK